MGLSRRKRKKYPVCRQSGCDHGGGLRRHPEGRIILRAYFYIGAAEGVHPFFAGGSKRLREDREAVRSRWVEAKEARG